MTDAIVSKWINQLIEVLHDSYDSYKECIEIVSNNFLKGLFATLAELRISMISELEEQAWQLQIEPEKTGNTLAEGHRLYIDLESLLAKGDADVIIKEIERSENQLINKYKRALESDLPIYIKSIIKAQLDQIQNNLDQVLVISAERAV